MDLAEEKVNQPNNQSLEVSIGFWSQTSMTNSIPVSGWLKTGARKRERDGERASGKDIISLISVNYKTSTSSKFFPFNFFIFTFK